MGEAYIIIIAILLLIALCWAASYCLSTPNKSKDVVVIVLQRFLSEEQGKAFRTRVLKPLAQNFQKDQVKLLYSGKVEFTFVGKEKYNSVAIYYFPSREICTHILEKITMAERSFMNEHNIENAQEDVRLNPPSLSTFNENEEKNKIEEEGEQTPTVITGKFLPVLPETRIATLTFEYFFYRILARLFKSNQRPFVLPTPFGYLPSISTSDPPQIPSEHHTSPLPQRLISFSDLDDPQQSEEEERTDPTRAYLNLHPHLFPTFTQLNQLTEKTKEKNRQPIYVINFVELNDSLANRAADIEYLKYILKSAFYSIPRYGGKIIYQGPFLSGNWSHFSIVQFPGGEETLIEFLGDSIYNNAILNYEKAATQSACFISRSDSDDVNLSHRSFSHRRDEYEV